ncbi:lipid A core-O-antigen ligase-like enyme [Beggiatoa alba B18LD]|uniref:Lipid A core-O-antigen ligase-like enyme n=1 Tax=Beggiatoa alba B18LD TaxID=395493 RepID=I3CL21_9GAMM|nr:O-antigen ligase family protein [Beggiatoa alba]EIJ44314.1 lipid A core-O-antigen ligase-like enyme [Beggiatoa alba B18LD]
MSLHNIRLSLYNRTDIRRVCTILLGIALGVSTGLTSFFLILAFILLFTEKANFQRYWFILRTHPVAQIATILLIFFIIGIFYSTADLKQSLSVLSKYRELFYIPIFIILFQDDETREGSLWAFVIVMAYTLILSYFMWGTGIQIAKGTPDNAFIFKNHISQSLMMSMVAYFLAIYGWQYPRFRWLCAIGIGLAMFNVLFMLHGRTGYIVLLCLVLLFIYQVARWRGLAFSILPMFILCVGIYMSSAPIQERLGLMLQELHLHEEGKQITSMGLRMEFTKNGFLLFSEHPWLGTGTGSVPIEYERQFVEKQHVTSTENLHNEYLMIGVQLGIVGVLLFMGLLGVLWYQSRYLTPSRYVYLAQGFVVAMAVGCLANSFLFDMTEGHFFAYFVGLFYSTLTQTKTA